MGIFDFFKGSNQRDFEENIRALSIKLGDASFAGAKELAEELDANIENKNIANYFVSILSQFIYFHMHVLGRRAFSILGLDKQRIVMVALGEFVLNNIAITICEFTKVKKSRKDEVKSKLYGEMDHVNNIYAKCTAFSSENDDILETAANHVFGKIIAQLIEEENDISIITKASKSITDSVLSYNKDEILRTLHKIIG